MSWARAKPNRCSKRAGLHGCTTSRPARTTGDLSFAKRGNRPHNKITMKMSNFQLLFLGIFAVFIIAGVIAFALYSAKPNSVGPVVIWGTLDGGTMEELINNLNQSDRSFETVSYI